MAITEDDRTSETGLFNYADAYLKAGDRIFDPSARGWNNAPAKMLHYHAVELYLKAYLRAQNVSAADLKGRQFGHRLFVIAAEAKSRGLEVPQNILEFLEQADELNDPIESRYLRNRNGPYIQPAEVKNCAHEVRSLARIALGF